MKRNISVLLIALTTMLSVSCTKKVDVAAVSTLLPGIQLSSLGMFTSGPYVLPTGTATNTIQILFGATTTGKTPGAFDVVISDATVTPNVVVQTLHFNSWGNPTGNPVTVNDSFNTVSAATISYTTVPSEYPNTTIYQGSIILKYGATAPFVTGKTYTVKATASTNDATPVASVLTVTKLIYIQ